MEEPPPSPLPPGSGSFDGVAGSPSSSRGGGGRFRGAPAVGSPIISHGDLRSGGSIKELGGGDGCHSRSLLDGDCSVEPGSLSSGRANGKRASNPGNGVAKSDVGVAMGVFAPRSDPRLGKRDVGCVVMDDYRPPVRPTIADFVCSAGKEMECYDVQTAATLHSVHQVAEDLSQRVEILGQRPGKEVVSGPSVGVMSDLPPLSFALHKVLLAMAHVTMGDTDQLGLRRQIIFTASFGKLFFKNIK